jgi:hypothetical protein
MEVLVLIAVALGTFAAVGAYLKAHGLKGSVLELHEAVEEIRADLYEDLRADIAAAIAEGADAVIAKLPAQKPPKPAKPAAAAPAGEQS